MIKKSRKEEIEELEEMILKFEVDLNFIKIKINKLLKL